MKRANFLLILCMVFQYSFLQAQSPKRKTIQWKYLSIATTNSHTAMPFGRFSTLLYKEFHPGVEIGTGINWKEKKKHDWFQTLKAGYSYHCFVQHSFMIYTETGYRYKFPKRFAANAKLGGGYLLSKEDSKVFVLNSKGEYELSKKFGRSHGWQH